MNSNVLWSGHSKIFMIILILFEILMGNFVFQNTAIASSEKQTQVAELFVATFNRAPTQAGLDYWVNSSFGIDLIAMSFFDQPETQTLYPEGNTNAEFVTAIFQNLFNRAPTQEGIDYWSGALDDGMSRAVMIEAVKNGATGTDRSIIDNKTIVALYYANMGLEAGDFYLFDVTEDTATVDSALDIIDALVAIDIPDDTTDTSDTDFEAIDWTDETHSNNADPNFEEVFDDVAVKRLDFVITEERWQSMLDDMTNLYGEFGSSNREQLTDRQAGSSNREEPIDGESGSSNPGELTDVDEDPIFVPAEVFYNGRQWYRVGVRFKGNSSLQSSWQQGILKLSFKLDFDEFEDDYPQIDNQRFYGFKKFSLKNNYQDKSFMREKVAAKVFENAGLAVSHTAFYTLYVDHGNGPEYFGLYTLVEEVDNTVIKTQFSDDDGNLYKPEDYGASFVNGSFSESDFEKKTNEDEEDWSDIIALFEALHDDSRTLDPESWRAGLEEIFNTEVFLKYLAVNTVIQNWDTYGIMTQNYYLYNDPDTSKLTWIPWDMNEALQEGNMGGALALDFSNIQAGGWPLIEYLYADSVYKAKYDAYVEDTLNVYFEETQMRAIYEAYSQLIEPYATSEIQGYSFLTDQFEFQQAISELHEHLNSRISAVENYLY